MSRTSALESTFEATFNLLAQADTPRPVREFRFANGRRWRFDFAWEAERVAVEIEGAIWVRGRHARGSGITNDIEKYNAATLLGWRVLRYTSNMLDGDPVAVVRQVEEVLRQ